MKTVAIIVLNYNGQQVLSDCLASLQLIKLPSGYKHLTILVDNGSSDGSQKAAIKQFSRTVLIQNQTNLGFAKAMNRGIKRALKLGADFVLLLNNDTVVRPDFLSRLLDGIKAPPVGIAGPILKHRVKEQTLYDHGGKINWLLGRTEHFNKPRIVLKQPTARDFISGACMLIKKAVIERTGLLDEHYFFYFEDVDFCLRAKKAGWQTVVVPNSIINHKVSSQADKAPWLKFYNQLRSNLIFVCQYQPWQFKPVGLVYVLLLAVKIIINRIRKR